MILVVLGLLVLYGIANGGSGSGRPTPSPVAASAPPTASSTPSATPTSCHMSAEGLPDPICTPGATNPAVTQANIATTICVAGYTATIRPPTSYTNDLKAKQMQQYGFTGSPADYEEDHVIALELGGDPRDPRNLWPQPRIGAGAASLKDRVENWAHAEVCAGRMQLADAQKAIASDWRALYQVMVAATTTPVPTAAATAQPTVTTTPPPPPSAPPASLPATAAPTAAPPATFTVTITRSIYGAVAATTSAGASCTATARLPSGSLSTAQGLSGTHVADNSGAVSWSYATSGSTKPGTGTHTVTCSANGQTATATAPFTVQ